MFTEYFLKIKKTAR